MIKAVLFSCSDLPTLCDIYAQMWNSFPPHSYLMYKVFVLSV